MLKGARIEGSPMAVTAYDHARKAGNKGDVWKHFCLLTVASRLADEADADRAFSYVETHAGQGLFDLRGDGAWRAGVGTLLSAPHALSEHPYFRSARDRAETRVYPGSWLLVLELLRRRGLRPALRLFDHSDEVAASIEALRGREDLDGVAFEKADGFEALQRVAPAGLVLIDPPYRPDPESDRRRVAKAMRALDEAGTPSLAWYPLLARRAGEPRRLVADAGLAGLADFEVVWDAEAEAGGMTGCGMLAARAAARALRDSRGDLETLATLMTAAFRLRAPRDS